MSLRKKVHGLIAVEGLDGTGKSSIVKELSHLCQAQELHTPSSIYRTLRSHLHDAPGLESFFMYLSSCAFALNEHLNSNKTFSIIDRYWISSIIDYAWKQGFSIQETQELTRQVLQWLPPPNYTIFLTCSRPTRLNRIHLRKNSSPRDREDENYEQYWFEQVKAISHFLGEEHYLFFDTSEFSAKESAQKIAAHLDRFFKKEEEKTCLN